MQPIETDSDMLQHVHKVITSSCRSVVCSWWFFVVLDKMVSTLDSMGIRVCQYHAESGPGQFEIATAPCEYQRACWYAVAESCIAQVLFCQRCHFEIATALCEVQAAVTADQHHQHASYPRHRSPQKRLQVLRLVSVEMLALHVADRAR